MHPVEKENHFVFAAKVVLFSHKGEGREWYYSNRLDFQTIADVCLGQFKWS
jgi:hypothetical protein